MASPRNPLFRRRPFHQQLPALPELPADRDPRAEVDPAALQQLLEGALQYLSPGSGILDRRELIFIDAWVRAFLSDYAPGKRLQEVRPADGQLLVALEQDQSLLEVPLRPGRSPSGGPSEFDYLQMDPCDMVAILCPVWTPLYAPLSLASLASLMAAADYRVEPVDLNIWCHRALKSLVRDDLAIMWRSQVNFTLWADEAEWADEMMQQFGPVFDHLVSNIVASGARMVGFTIYSSNAELTIRLAAKIKRAKPEIAVVIGGSGATALARFVHRNGYHGLPSERLEPYDPWRVVPEWYHRLLHSPDIDYLVAGEAELTLPRLLRTLDAGGDGAEVPGVGTLRDGQWRFSPEEIVFDLDQIPYADFRRLEPERYGRPDHLPFWFSRGCINRCAYCTNNAYFEKAYRCRSPKNAVDEMRQLQERYEITTLGFTDLCCNGNMAGLDAMLDHKIAEGVDLGWHSYVVMRPDMPKELVEKMVRSGNIRFEYGFESGSDDVLRLMGKTYDSEVAARLLRWTTSAGGLACVNLVVGFPHETQQNFEETLAFIEDNGRWIGQVASMNSFAMMPHSRVLERAEQLGIYVGRNYGDWRLHDGSNDAKLRVERVNKLCRVIDELEVCHGSPYDLTINEEAPDVSVARRLVHDSDEHPDHGTVRSGPLEVTFRHGTLAIRYGDQEITEGMHAYTAMMFEDGAFVDSQHALRWAVAVEESHRLRAAAFWPDRRLRQLWLVNLLSDRTVRLVIENWNNEPATIQRRQTHLMLRGEYTHYRVLEADGQYRFGQFEDVIPEEGQPWHRAYFAPQTPTLEVFPAGELPGVRMEHEPDLRWDYHSGMLLTGHNLRRARVLQHLLVDDEKVEAVNYYYYKGKITVVPRGEEE